MALSLLINDVERVGLLRAGTLSIQAALNGRNTCRCALRDPSVTVHPAVGQTIEVRDGATTVFKGTLDRIRERMAAAATMLLVELEAVDFNQLADRHIVAELYENLTMKQIVEDIRVEHLAADGVTLDPAFPDGPVFERIPFDHVPVSQAFTELSEMTGFAWDIGYDKVLRFIDRSTMTAPQSLEASAPVWLDESLEVEHTRERYRNEQIIRGGVTVTDTAITKTFHGDGATQQFTLDLDVDAVVSITVNGVSKTFGVRGVDTGKDWYYQRGDKVISQDASGTKLTASDTLVVSYFGQFPLRVALLDTVRVSERQAVEGGSGLYTAIEDFEDIDRLTLARDRAEGLIRRFGSIDTRVTFVTRSGGWQPGQLIATVNVPQHGLSSSLLVSEVELADQDGVELRTRITAVSGLAVESWVEFFTRLAQGGRRKAIRENEVLHLVRAFGELMNASETFAAATGAPPFKWDVHSWGAAQWS